MMAKDVKFAHPSPDLRTMVQSVEQTHAITVSLNTTVHVKNAQQTQNLISPKEDARTSQEEPI